MALSPSQTMHDSERRREYRRLARRKAWGEMIDKALAFGAWVIVVAAIALAVFAVTR